MKLHRKIIIISISILAIPAYLVFANQADEELPKLANFENQLNSAEERENI